MNSEEFGRLAGGLHALLRSILATQTLPLLSRQAGTSPLAAPPSHIASIPSLVVGGLGGTFAT